MLTARDTEQSRVYVDTVWQDEKVERPYNPWESRDSMKPYKPMAQGKLRDYFGGRFDLLAYWLQRKGISMDADCKAYISGHNKMLTIGNTEYMVNVNDLIYVDKKH